MSELRYTDEYCYAMLTVHQFLSEGQPVLSENASVLASSVKPFYLLLNTLVLILNTSCDIHRSEV